MQYYSQFGQDQYLWEKYFQHGVIGGTFVDIGAHDGVSGSNTKFFEDQGWSGICFEPVPQIFERLKTNRQCMCVNKALSNKVGTAKFKYLPGYSEMLSGLLDEYTQGQLDRINREVAEHKQVEYTIDVETSLFELEVPKDINISLLSIDVEGSEETIIRSIDFDHRTIIFMTVEFNEPNDALHHYILSKGYALDMCLGVDWIYRKI